MIGIFGIWNLLQTTNDIGKVIVYVLISAVTVLFSLTIHEIAHGYTAYKLGDPTAKNMGRLTLNPLVHLDPVGAICMLFFGWGWAKAVSFNPFNLKNRKRDVALISLAGPLSNLLLAFISLGLLRVSMFFASPDSSFYLACIQFFLIFSSLNIGLAIFNLLPIPPLDGSKILAVILPERAHNFLLQYERFGFIVLIFLVMNGSLSRYLSFGLSTVFNFFTYILGIPLRW